MEELMLLKAAINRRDGELCSIACKRNSCIHAAIDDYKELLKTDPELLMLKRTIND